MDFKFCPNCGKRLAPEPDRTPRDLGGNPIEPPPSPAAPPSPPPPTTAGDDYDRWYKENGPVIGNG